MVKNKRKVKRPVGRPRKNALKSNVRNSRSIYNVISRDPIKRTKELRRLVE
jgi:hypothetical protein